jgi:Protein of unknown function (DUF2568)
VTGLAWLNAGLRFVLELVGIVALGIWGWTAAGESPFRIALAIAAPLVLIAVWARLIAPRSRSPLDPRTRFVVGSGLLLATAGALWAAGHPTAAALFAILIAVNTALAFAFKAPGLFEAGPN